jgi:uncharacterized membrane protein (UPF0127 family)
MSLSALLIAHFRKWQIASVFLVFAGNAAADSRPANLLSIDIHGAVYRVELATTPETRARGLMFRESLDPHGGMLLVFAREGDRRIWMKNVPIALRVYWIDDDYEVVAELRLPPCKADPCPVYAAGRPARYVLELADRDHPLRVGDRINGLDSLPR